MRTNQRLFSAKQYSVANITFTLSRCFSFQSVSLPLRRRSTAQFLFPAGGQLGTTIEIAIQGSDLEGAHTLIIEGEPASLPNIILVVARLMTRINPL